jgi:hypothetical protein
MNTRSGVNHFQDERWSGNTRQCDDLCRNEAGAEGLAHHLGIDTSKVTLGCFLIDGLGADSLDTVELVLAYE